MQALPWWEPQLGEEEAEAVARVVRSGYINEGQETAKFTETVGAALGVKHVLATTSGTVALILALKACGVKPGDEVIIPDLTFIATANAVAFCGAKPVLVDIRLEDLNIDPKNIEDVVSNRTRAIIPVHINGRAADLNAIRTIAERHGLAIIEDAAQALASYSNERALGTIGDVGAISLAPTKIITSGQGGLVMTNRDDIHDQVVRLKDHGRLSRSWNYHPEIGFNFKYTDVLAAIALVQFGHLEDRKKLVQRHYALYREALSDLEPITFIETDINGGTVPLWVDALVDDASALIDHLKNNNIQCRPFWPAIHTQAPYQTTISLSKSLYAATHGVWFPSGIGKTDADIEKVVEVVRSYLTA